MTYGQGTMGVSPSMLLVQRRAVAATLVAHGVGDLDLTLPIGDGSARGKVDLAFEAHLAPIGSWACAAW